MLVLIDRFGAPAVLGRATLGVREMRWMLYVETIIAAVRSRNAADDPILWEVKHPDLAEVLEEIGY